MRVASATSDDWEELALKLEGEDGAGTLEVVVPMKHAADCVVGATFVVKIQREMASPLSTYNAMPPLIVGAGLAASDLVRGAPRTKRKKRRKT